MCDGIDDEGADGCGGRVGLTANAVFAEYAVFRGGFEVGDGC